MKSFEASIHEDDVTRQSFWYYNIIIHALKDTCENCSHFGATQSLFDSQFVRVDVSVFVEIEKSRISMP